MERMHGEMVPMSPGLSEGVHDMAGAAPAPPPAGQPIRPRAKPKRTSKPAAKAKARPARKATATSKKKAKTGVKTRGKAKSARKRRR